MPSSFPLLIATALLATVAACTEDLDPTDAESEAMAKDVVVPIDVTLDTVVATECAAPKVMVCHIPPGNPANAHNICIAAEAVQTHIDLHGDSVGACAPPAPLAPVCLAHGAECTTDLQCCSNACVWDECIDEI